MSCGACPVVLVDGKYELIKDDNIEYQDTNDGDISALLVKGNKYAFTFGHSKEEVTSRVLKGIDADIKSAESKKLAYYEKYSRPDMEKYSELYSKCISAMKTQLYSPEGDFKTIWSPLTDFHTWIYGFGILFSMRWDSVI